MKVKGLILQLTRLCCGPAFVSLAVLWAPVQLTAASLDEGVQEDVFLATLAEALGVYDIDVTSNLNSREVMRQSIGQPRLGRFPDLPINSLSSSAEIENWESAYTESEIGGIAILANDSAAAANEAFLESWLQSPSERRLFVSFHESDLASAEKVAEIASAYGHDAELLFDVEQASSAAELYATAAQRLAIDSRTARRYRSDVTEFEYLGERVRRKSDSLFKDDGNRGDGSLARREPAVFMKETLGDEFNQSTIEAIIVPGGVALGETAELDFMPVELVFTNSELTLLDEEGVTIRLPQIELATAKALYDFVVRSQAIASDAIVDIDADGRVRISSALRDTDAGYAIMHADTQPFEFVPDLPVTKSVIIDMNVDWAQQADAEPLRFEVGYEVRFLSADNMRIAQTRAALEYEYDSEEKISTYSDSWGRYTNRLDENLDFSGLGQSMQEVATYAAWVGLFRRLHEDEVRFLRGRYAFMKIDKTGRKTPISY